MTVSKKLPLLYTHPIGSLPRPLVVRDLLRQRDERPNDLSVHAALDDFVRFAIRLQETAGMDVVSDGEWRRTQYIQEFLMRVGGFEACRVFEHQGEVKMSSVVVRRMPTKAPVFADDAQFLVANTERFTKFALPSPFLIAVRYWHEDYSREAYPTAQHFMDHLTEILAVEARVLAEIGIDVIQLDDPALTYYCDTNLMAGKSIHDQRLLRLWDANREVPAAVEAINRIADGLQAEVHVHSCHSVYKRQADVVGDYKPLLPRLDNLRVDRVNLEFAYPQTGDVSDLDLLPNQLQVGLGIVDVRTEQLQSVEQIAGIARAGIQRLGVHRIALNPDCGFAPDAGEPPTIDEAYQKLCRLTEAARQLRAEHSAKSSTPL